MENKDRQKKFREERKAAGYKLLRIWIKPEWEERIQALISKLKEK